MTDIWDERPLIYIEEPEDADKLDAWLEKLKAEYDRSEKEGLEHYAIAVEYYEKLEAVKSFLEGTIADEVWFEWQITEYAKEVLRVIGDYNNE